MDNNTSVSYNALNSQITKIQKLCENGYNTYINIQTLKSHFLVSNSDVANELKNIIYEYEEAYKYVLKLCNKSISMLEKAKYVYENSDNTTNNHTNGGDD